MATLSAICKKRLNGDLKLIKGNPHDIIEIVPDDTNMLIWYFLVKGPKDSDYENGYYIGKLTHSPNYPFSPPDFIMLTPSGRFKIEKKICLTNTGFHTNEWSPMWTIHGILTGFVSIMLEDKDDGISHIKTSKHEREKLALESVEYNKKYHHNILKYFTRFLDQDFNPIIDNSTLEIKPDEKPVPIEPDEKPVPMKPNEKPVSMKPNEKLVPMKPDEKPIPMKPDEKPIPMKPDEKLVPMKPDEKPVPMKPNKKPVLKKPDVKYILMKPNEKLVQIEPDEKPVPMKLNEKPVPIEPNEKPVLIESAEKPDLKESDESEEEIPNKKKYIMIKPSAMCKRVNISARGTITGDHSIPKKKPGRPKGAKTVKSLKPSLNQRGKK